MRYESLLLAGHGELTRGFEQLRYGFFRAGFRVDAQQRLSARGAKQQPGLCRVWLYLRFRVVEEKLDPVEGFNVFDRHPGEFLYASLRPRNSGILQLVVDVQVDAPILVLAVLVLKLLDQLAQSPALFRHNVREQ